MEVNEVLLEILDEVKKLAVEQASVNARLEACVLMTNRQDADIKVLQVNDSEVHKHGVILKGMLWMYGLIVAGLVGKLLSSKFLS